MASAEALARAQQHLMGGGSRTIWFWFLAQTAYELRRVWWRDVSTLEVFHTVILLFLPRSGSISLTPLTGHWPCDAKSPDPGLGQRGARAWDQDQFFLRNVAALWCISSDTYEWLVLRLPTFTSTRKKFTNCVMPRPRYGAGFALTEHTERFRWRLADIKWRWKNSIFSSKVIFTQLSRGNIVTKCLLLSFLKLECQTNLFLGKFFGQWWHHCPGTWTTWDGRRCGPWRALLLECCAQNCDWDGNFFLAAVRVAALW